MAKLPSVTSKLPRDLKNFLDRVREAFDNTVTRQQLESGEVVPKSVREGIGANGFETDPETGQPVAPPPAPTGITVTGGYRTIMLEWDEAFYPGHAHTQVWAAQQTDQTPNPTIDDAFNLAIAPGELYTHNAGNNETWYYWLYHVNINNLRGPVNSSDGTVGSTAVDVEYLIDELSNEITESELAGSLNARLDDYGLKIGKHDDQYTVKIDNNGGVAGFGLANRPPDDTTDSSFSEFYVNADRFAVLPQGESTSNAVAPFIVDGGVVYIDSARIADGTITRAKIGSAAIDNARIANGAITSAKIANGQITNAKIDNAAIDSAQIQNGAITNAKIGNAAITNAKIADASIDSAKITSVTADKIDTNTLSALTSNMGVLTAGRIQSNDGDFVIDLNQKTIKITV